MAISLPTTYQAARTTVHSHAETARFGDVLEFEAPLSTAQCYAVEDVLPRHMLKRQGTTLSYRHMPVAIGSWKQGLGDMGETPRRFVFIPYRANRKLLDKAIASVPEDIPALVVDHSQSLEVGRDIPSRWALYRTNRDGVTFAKIQNLIRFEAKRTGVLYYFFMHSDAECTKQTFTELDQLAKMMFKSGNRNGLLFTAYDALAAIRTEAAWQTGPWDEWFEWYHSDVDWYRRMILAGWELKQSGLGKKVAHYASSTIASDPQAALEVREQFQARQGHYKHKWGGERGHEQFLTPYNAK